MSKRFADVVAVDGLSFELTRGTLTGFLGPNGAGKTTTLRMLLGLVAPTEGSATVLGRSYRELDEPARRVGVVLEDADFHPARSGRNHLRVLALAAGVPDTRVDEVLDAVGLADDASRAVGGYSLGMRRRLALACALLGDPELLVLDEPANGLDPAGIRWLRDLLRSLVAEGRTVLFSSHVLAEVSQTVDRVIIVNRGRLVAQGRLEEITKAVGGGARVRAPDAEALQRILAEGGLEAVLMGTNEIFVPNASAAQVGELAARAGVALHGLTEERSTLEEVFLGLTTEAPGE